MVLSVIIKPKVHKHKGKLNMTFLDDLTAINNAAGSDKILELRNRPQIKFILKAAYDPFIKYYLSPPELLGVEGCSGLTAKTKYILDSLSKRLLSGLDALEAVCDHICELNPDAAEVFKRILSKDLRCGINIKTINKAFPNLIPLVWDGSTKPPFALCKTFDPDKAIYPLMAAIKKDGIRGQYVDKLISRQGKQLTGLDHIEDQIDINLDGEIVVPGMCFDDSSGIIRKEEYTPEAEFWVFDAPSIIGSKLDRYEWLKENLKQTDAVKLLRHHWIADSNKLYAFYDHVVNDLNEEGIVLYDPDADYEDGRIWHRFVPVKSEDLKVIGFYEGKGKNQNSLGGIVFDYKGHEINVGTGFTEKILKSQENQPLRMVDETLLRLNTKTWQGVSLHDVHPMWLKNRKFIWDNQQLFLGRIAKIEYKEITKYGALRQPRFKGWRFDKDC